MQNHVAHVPATFGIEGLILHEGHEVALMHHFAFDELLGQGVVLLGNHRISSIAGPGTGTNVPFSRTGVGT